MGEWVIRRRGDMSVWSGRVSVCDFLLWAKEEEEGE